MHTPASRTSSKFAHKRVLFSYPPEDSASFWGIVTTFLSKHFPGVDRNTINQALFLFWFSLIADAALVIFGLVHIVTYDQIALGFIKLVFALLVTTNLWYVFQSKNIAVGKSVFLALLLGVLLILFVTGGLAQTGILWFFSFPIACFFLHGKRNGLWWMASLYGLTSLCVLLSYVGLFSLPYTQLIIRQTGVILLIITIGIYIYEHTKEQGEKTAAQLAAIVESAEDAIISLDLHGRIVSWNKGAQYIFGYDESEMLGNSMYNILESQYAGELKKMLAKVAKGESFKHFEIRYEHIKRKTGYVSLTVSPLKGMDNEVVGAAITGRDISYRKILEAEVATHTLQLETIISERTSKLKDNLKELKEAKAKEDSLLAGIGECMIATDRDGNINYINNVAANLLHLVPSKAYRKHFDEAIQIVEEPGEESKKRISALKSVTFHRKTVSGEFTFVTTGGSRLPVYVTASPILVNNRVTGSIIIFRDITQEKEVEKIKTELISLVSHELRTPMTAIKGYLSMIQHGDFGEVDTKLRKPLDQVYNSTDRLIALVNDILKASRIEAGKIKYDISVFDLKHTVEEVIAELAPLAQQKSISLLTSVKDSIQLEADESKVKEILNNLVGNSLKFTLQGYISIGIKKKDDVVDMLVTDSGVGIPDSEFDKLFGKFESIETPTDQMAEKPYGSGLGLYISREQARKMGGDVYLVSSTPGQGTTFAVTIPLAGSQRATKAKTQIEKEEQYLQKL